MTIDLENVNRIPQNGERYLGSIAFGADYLKFVDELPEQSSSEELWLDSQATKVR